MRPFRSLLVCRVLALALAGALGLAVAAPASARSGSLRTVLGDDHAVDAALAATRGVAPADRLEAFAQAYAQTADDGTTAETVERLLGADSMSGTRPAVVERAFAPSGPPASALSAAALPSTRQRMAATGETLRAGRQLPPAPRRVATDSRPRAP